VPAWPRFGGAWVVAGPSRNAIQRMSLRAADLWSHEQLATLLNRVFDRYPVSVARSRALLVGVLIVAALTPVARASADVWSAVAPIAEPRAAATATLLKDGEVLVAGGYNGFTEHVGGGTTWQRLAELFDPATRSSRPTAPTLVPRVEPRTRLLGDGRVLVLGVLVLGVDSRDLNNAYVYGPPPSPAINSQQSSTSSLATLPPTLTHLHQSHRRWRDTQTVDRVHRKSRPATGTAFSFVLDEPATVELVFLKHAHGDEINQECVIETRGRHGRPCIRTISKGSLSAPGKAGENVVVFDGRTSRSHKLGPGDYTLEIKATNRASQSETSKLSFTIL